MLAVEPGNVRVTQVVLVVKGWHCVRAESLKKAPERLMVKVQSRCSFGDASAVGGPPAAAEWSQLEPRRQAVCAVEGGRAEATQAPWRSSDCEGSQTVI